jgi:hypothetical protein
VRVANAKRVAMARLLLSAMVAMPCALQGAPAAAQDQPIGIQRPRASDAPRKSSPRVQPDDFGDSSPASDIPPVTPSDDPSVTAADPDDNDPARAAAGQRVVRQDGDMSDPEPPQLRDGIIDTGEPDGVRDGVDPSLVDTRPRDEAALFETPASTVDELLFQVEDLDPILDRRPQRLFRFEPYDPVGIRAGSFVIFPEAEISGHAFSNVFRAPAKRSDGSFDVRPSIRIVSNWRRHAVEFRGNGLATFYGEYPTENDKAYTLEARGRLDITKRTNLQSAVSHDVSQESRSAPDGRGVGTRADVTTDKVALALSHTFNRLTVQLRGAVTEQAFGDSTTAGVTSSNRSRDFTTYDEAVRASWAFKPTLAAFTEVALNQRDYALADGNGIDRSSTGERTRVGLSFGNTGTFLRGEAAVGYGVQRPSNSSLPDVSGVIRDANVTWRPTELTSVAFNARSDVAETTSVGVGGVRVQSVGLEARHAFTRTFIATGGLTYTTSDYIGSPLVEDEWLATLGAEYFLNRETVLFGRYAHTNFMSNAANASYDTDELRLGVRIRR